MARAPFITAMRAPVCFRVQIPSGYKSGPLAFVRPTAEICARAFSLSLEKRGACGSLKPSEAQRYLEIRYELFKMPLKKYVSVHCFIHLVCSEVKYYGIRAETTVSTRIK